MLFGPLGEIVSEYGKLTFDAILVGSGPGSYSGTRVGIAAAQGAALVAGCKAVAVPSILATGEALSGKPCLAVGDARRGAFWTARINEHQLQQAPELTDRIGFDQALELAKENELKIFSFETIRDTEIPRSLPSASGLWKAWRSASPNDRAIWAGAIPQPIYLAPPHITASKKAVYGNANGST